MWWLVPVWDCSDEGESLLSADYDLRVPAVLSTVVNVSVCPIRRCWWHWDQQDESAGKALAPGLVT